MSDFTDVQSSLVNLIAGVLFPAGYLDGSPTVSLLGPTIKLYAGWANSAALDSDLQNGIAHVTVFTDPGAARLTTRYQRNWTAAPIVPPTLLATVSGQSVTISGTVSTSQIAGIQLYHNAPVGYRCTANDTTSSVASALAALLPYASPTVAANVITFPATVSEIVAKTAADTVASVETRRQEQTFRVTVWAPTPAVRTLIASAIDNAMANVRFIALPDGTVTNIPLYRGMYDDDVPQTAHEWRRDLKYAIEYPTIYTMTATQILFPYVNMNGSANNPVINNPVIPNINYNITTEDGTAILGTSTGLPLIQEGFTNQ